MWVLLCTICFHESDSTSDLAVSILFVKFNQYFNLMNELKYTPLNELRYFVDIPNNNITSSTSKE